MLNTPDTIKMVITDFDGIITDNCVYINEKEETSRKLNFKDIMAFSILKKNGYEIAIISGEKNSAISLIKKKFDIKEVHENIRNKFEILSTIIQKYNLKNDEYIYIGDDINDYESLCNTKYAFTVPNAVKKVKEIKHIQITSNYGGDGAFREIIDSIVKF